MRRCPLILVAIGLVVSALADVASAAESDKANLAEPQFSRHVIAVFSRAGCNSGSCHGAVQGKNGLRLSLFGANPELDHVQLVRDQSGRRIDRLEPEKSLLLRKATSELPHGGGRLISPGSVEYEILRRWIATGASLDQVNHSRVAGLHVMPREQVLQPGGRYRLHVEAEFVDGTREEVTALCAFESRDDKTATVDREGRVTAVGIGDAAMQVRYRSHPAMSMALVAREANEPFPEIAAHNFIDEHILGKLRRLNIPPSGLADDATFLRRVRLDVTGQLPSPAEVREFLADTAADKRAKKIEQLLNDPGYSAVWAWKFCDLLGASDFGVYADALAEHFEAPRFQAWVRARLDENLPYDEFAARILLATSREGRSLEDWAQEVIALQDGYKTPRTDLETYAQRKTLDAYWQRKDAVGVAGAMQVAHTFLGLRLQCAQCHRHPHDVWQQDDLLSFANFFMRVRTVGFQGDNEKKFPDDAKLFKQFEADGKKLNEDAKKLKDGPAKELAEKARKAQNDVGRLKNEIAKAEQQKAAAEVIAAKREELAAAENIVAANDAMQKQIRELERRGRVIGDEVAKRVLHAQILSVTGDAAAKKFASVTSPLGTQTSQDFRLLGERESVAIAADEDPRIKFVEWLRRADNPLFAKAIVNRVWAHYFDRGLVDPRDDLSPFNPSTHPALLDELARRFVEQKYDLKWLHRTILASRTFQQSSATTASNQDDRTNYSHFALRRLPAEVLLDAVNQSTGTTEDLDMKYFHWPDNLTTVEVPYMPRNGFVTFVLEQFGRSERNSSAQCDCQRQSEASMLQVLSIANHPRFWQKISDPRGRVATLLKEAENPRSRIEALYLSTLSRMPEATELRACEKYVSEAESPEKGMQGVLWSLLNTREFLLQH